MKIFGKKNETKKMSEHTHDEDATGQKTMYYCPMHCEGDKIYDKPGRCPVCNMYLVPVENAEQNKKHQHH